MVVFFAMGCWNRGRPDDDNEPMNHVINHLTEVIKAESITRGFILGDNYYPLDKKEEEKLPTEKWKWHTEEVYINMKVKDMEIKQKGGAKHHIVKLDRIDTMFQKLNEIEVPIVLIAGNHEIDTLGIKGKKTKSGKDKKEKKIDIFDGGEKKLRENFLNRRGDGVDKPPL